MNLTALNFVNLLPKNKTNKFGMMKRVERMRLSEEVI